MVATLAGRSIDCNANDIPDECAAVCCHGCVCYEVDPCDPGDPHNEATCLTDGGMYFHPGVTCADAACGCGGTDYRSDSNCLDHGPDA